MTVSDYPDDGTWAVDDTHLACAHCGRVRFIGNMVYHQRLECYFCDLRCASAYRGELGSVDEAWLMSEEEAERIRTMSRRD